MHAAVRGGSCVFMRAHTHSVPFLMLVGKGAGSVRHLDGRSLEVEECIKGELCNKISREERPVDALAGTIW